MFLDRSRSNACVLVIQPDPLGRLFQLAGCFETENVDAVPVRPYEDEQVPARLDADGLIVLGGHMSSLDDADFPWLADIRALQRDAAAQGKPSLGICLGAQLMAQAFGGSTAVGEAGLETGTVEVDWLPDADRDPLLNGLPSPHLAGTMHGDAVTELPPGAVWLGTAPLYRHQAFRVGDASWGLQFHPELDLAAYHLWVDSHQTPTPADRERLDAGAKALQRDEDKVLRGNRILLRTFLRLLRHSTRPESAGERR